ncbi:histidine phosphotransferase family protein [Paracoccus aerodenitrificans]|uniref:histidine phosphotransferase family protein n=1 Tax=Paracoccus aerodenitrificans TaxID=3017781 RepID=UPI0022F01B10|nr:histidine phosphotransferase family protein [Paracoccus aerodenitrificans]WBU65362.1 histidine phosphotransferase family protein [Paracoccus aerodenitrificans]
MTYDLTETDFAARPGRDLSARVAALLGSRLCHDLVSPLGAICNGVELLQMAGDWPGLAESEEMSMIDGALSAARARLSCFRVAFGSVGASHCIRAKEFAHLVAEIEKSGKMRISLHSDSDHSRQDVKMVLLALMCLHSAMPWGASIVVRQQAAHWHLRAEGSRTRHDTALWSWLGSDVNSPDLYDPPAAEVHFPLLAITAAEAGRMIRWSLCDTGAEISF